jgi:hypothetical protein
MIKAMNKWLAAFENWDANQSFYIHEPLKHELKTIEK